MLYFAHYEEDAVCREDENGECFAKRWTTAGIDLPGYVTAEYRLGKGSDIRHGNPDYQSIPVRISKEDYDTFGVTWKFGSEWPPPGCRFPKVGIGPVGEKA